MSRGRARYTESDVTRILKAAAKVPVDVRVTIDTAGNIIIATNGKPCDANENGAAAQADDLDRELKEFQARHGRN